MKKENKTKVAKTNISKVENKIKLEVAKQQRLNLQQTEYCYYYTLEGYVTYGNATLSYAVAYGYDLPTKDDGSLDIRSSEYTVCQAASSRMSGLPYIRNQIEKIMLERLNDNSIDSRLSSIIHAGKDTDSIQGIKIYNDLKGRVTRNLNLNVNARPLEQVTDEELERMANGNN